EAPKPVVKTPTGRQPGGQPGHPGHRCHRLPPERLDAVIPHVPTTWASCQAPWPHEAGPHDPEPTWHPVIELPPIRAPAVEHPGHARTCGHGGAIPWAAIPEQARPHRLGPRRTAVVSYCSGGRHVSRRDVVEISEALFGVPVARGTVATSEPEV